MSVFYMHPQPSRRGSTRIQKTMCLSGENIHDLSLLCKTTNDEMNKRTKDCSWAWSFDAISSVLFLVGMEPSANCFLGFVFFVWKELDMVTHLIRQVGSVKGHSRRLAKQKDEIEFQDARHPGYPSHMLNKCDWRFAGNLESTCANPVHWQYLGQAAVVEPSERKGLFTVRWPRWRMCVLVLEGDATCVPPSCRTVVPLGDSLFSTFLFSFFIRKSFVGRRMAWNRIRNGSCFLCWILWSTLVSWPYIKPYIPGPGESKKKSTKWQLFDSSPLCYWPISGIAVKSCVE